MKWAEPDREKRGPDHHHYHRDCVGIRARGPEGDKRRATRKARGERQTRRDGPGWTGVRGGMESQFTRRSQHEDKTTKARPTLEPCECMEWSVESGWWARVSRASERVGMACDDWERPTEVVGWRWVQLDQHPTDKGPARGSQAREPRKRKAKGNARHGMARQGKARQGKARRGDPQANQENNKTEKDKPTKNDCTTTEPPNHQATMTNASDEMDRGSTDHLAISSGLRQSQLSPKAWVHGQRCDILMRCGAMRCGNMADTSLAWTRQPSSSFFFFFLFFPLHPWSVTSREHMSNPGSRVAPRGKAADEAFKEGRGGVSEENECETTKLAGPAKSSQPASR